MTTHGLLLAVAIGIAVTGCGRALKPDDIVLRDPTQAVLDARQLVQAKQADPALYPNWLYPKDLPPSLHIAGLECAVVHEDHLDLLMSRAPDWWVGARIWTTNSLRQHSDRKTRYPDVYFFTYSNDSPVSPTNIR